MKRSFTMIKIVQFVFLLWSGVVANAQSSGTNSTSSMEPNFTTLMPTTDIGSHGELSSSRSNFIVVSIAVVCCLAAIVIIIGLSRIVRRKPCRRKRETVRMFSNHGVDDLCSGELGRMEECEEPDHFVERSMNVSIKMSTHCQPTLTKERASRILYRGKQGDDQSDIPASFNNGLAEEVDLAEEDVPKSDLHERRSKTLSMSAGLVKKNITVNGGTMKIDDIVLNVGPGCLAKDTEITLIKDDQNPSFKSLLDLDLVKAVPRVVEFLPDGLKFLKPAELSIKYEKIFSDAELYILHGSYNRDYQRTVWELVTNYHEDNREDGVVNMKISGFCFFSYIYAKRGELSRILSHLNRAFTCRAYALYRRVPFMDTIDFSVVLFSNFVEKNNDEKDIQQLKDHFEAGYEIGEKGMLKRVHTDRSLKISLGFPGIKHSPFAVKVDQPELDSVGFVIDHFKGIDQKLPLIGVVEVYETHRTAPKKLLWKLNVCEIQEKTFTKEKAEVQTTEEDEVQEKVVCRKTKLRSTEITRMSRVVGVDWDSLAGLMDIPYSEREEIRVNNIKYPDSYSKAEQIFALFNDRENFGRHILEMYFYELGCPKAISEMLPVENENDDDDISQPLPLAPQCENVVLNNTPLSPREMCRLSRKIVVDWDSLAGLMDIASEVRQNVRCNRIYNDERARAEKILSIINQHRDFSREKLVERLKWIERLDLIEPIETGQWRSL